MVEELVSVFQLTPHRFLVCPDCGGTLATGKRVYDSERGFRYRIKGCQSCGSEWGTKQAPEELTGKIEAIIE